MKMPEKVALLEQFLGTRCVCGREKCPRRWTCLHCRVAMPQHEHHWQRLDEVCIAHLQTAKEILALYVR